MIKRVLAVVLFVFCRQDAVNAFTIPTSNINSRHCSRQSLGSLFIRNQCTKLDATTTKTAVEKQLVSRDVNVLKQSPITIQKGATQVVTDGMPSLLQEESIDTPEVDATNTYRNGLFTIGFITLLFASNSPILHSAFELTTNAPPVLLVNAAVTVVGLLGVVLLSPILTQFVPDPSLTLDDDIVNDNNNMDSTDTPSNNMIMNVVGSSAIAGAELGLWKFLGTTANIYGLSQTSSDHGAFLIQLTTLLVPAAQGLMGVPIPTRIWSAIGLALGGVFMFTQDPNQNDCASLQGDLLCALAAVFYATYDLRLFKWGKIIPTNELITTKMMTQSALSLGLLLALGQEETLTFISQVSLNDSNLVIGVSIWSGLAVNCLAPYLQVSGQQAVGPARAQILYASQPLWAAIMSYFLLREQVGFEGITGGSAFLCAMFLAATAETPDANCPAKECEV
mmetsp:Transcript_19809/g.42606  ORF Transcript_19809/g.42606 Transcript_19809/m.42606 type:complete len:450 (-) Transcript_19809:27-1376(-)